MANQSLKWSARKAAERGATSDRQPKPTLRPVGIERAIVRWEYRDSRRGRLIAAVYECGHYRLYGRPPARQYQAGICSRCTTEAKGP